MGTAFTSQTAALPPGSVVTYAGASAPTGYLLCDGSAVSRTTYADLFAAISTTYGTGDGSTTFNVPDTRGRMIAGYAASGGHTDVSTLGNADAVTLANRRPKHKHTFTGTAGTTGAGSAHTHAFTGSGVTSGAGSAHTHSFTGGALPNHVHSIVTTLDGGTTNVKWSNDGGNGTNSASTDNPTSNPAVTGTNASESAHTHSVTAAGTNANESAHTHSFTPAGTIGTSTDQADAPAYIVLNHIIKT